MAFAENLKEKRAQSGLTQAELAMKAGVTARTIQNYELGTRKPGNMVIVQRIADALGTTTEQLLRAAKRSSSQRMSEAALVPQKTSTSW